MIQPLFCFGNSDPDVDVTGCAPNTLILGNSYLQSDNYSQGQAGWMISPSGDAEFQNVTVRGSIYSSSGQIGGLNIFNTGFSAARMSLDSSSGIIVVKDGVGTTSTVKLDTASFTMQNTFGAGTVYLYNTPSFQMIGGNETVGVPKIILTKTTIFDQNNFVKLYTGYGGSGGLSFTNTEIYEYSPILCSVKAGLRVENIGNYSNNAAAISAGLISGQLYRNGDVLQIVH